MGNPRTLSQKEAYQLAGASYLEAAAILFDQLDERGTPVEDGLYLVAQNLTALSLELALKHYILEKGCSDPDRLQKKYGHKLDRLFRLALKAGLAHDAGNIGLEEIVIQAQRTVKILHPNYSANSYRYFHASSFSIIHGQDVLRSALENIGILLNLPIE